MLSKRTVRFRHQGSGIARICVGLALAAISLKAQAPGSSVKRFTHDRDIETSFVWSSPPRWEGNLLVGYVQNHSSSPVIFTIDRDGRRDETLVRLPDIGLMNLYDISVSRAGEIAFVGSAYTADGRSTTFVARISADRQLQTFTRVWPYCPTAVAFVPDGTVWTIGHIKNKENTAAAAFNVLRRFDATGKMLGSTNVSLGAPRSQETSYLRSSLDRVGWLTRDLEYIEFSLDGNEIAKYTVPEVASERDITGLALSDENDVLVGRFGQTNTAFLMLDRTSRTWNVLSLPKEYAPAWVGLKGFDGKILVTNTRNGTIRRFKPE